MDDAERARMTARLNELGLSAVRNLAALDGFSHTWRLGVLEWIRDQEKAAESQARPTQAADQPQQ